MRNCYGSLHLAQTMFETSVSPILIMVLPVWEDLRTKCVWLLAASHTTKVRSSCNQWYISCKTDILWCQIKCTIMIYGLCRAYYIMDCVRLLFKLKDNVFCLLREINENKANRSASPCSLTKALIFLVVAMVGNISFKLFECMLCIARAQEDCKLEAHMSKLWPLRSVSFLSMMTVCFTFLCTRGSYRTVSKAALRGLTAPASSASSERDVSLLIDTMSKHKGKLKYDLLDAKAVLYLNWNDSKNAVK